MTPDHTVHLTYWQVSRYQHAVGALLRAIDRPGLDLECTLPAQRDYAPTGIMGDYQARPGRLRWRKRSNIRNLEQSQVGTTEDRWGRFGTFHPGHTHSHSHGYTAHSHPHTHRHPDPHYHHTATPAASVQNYS